MNLTLLFFVIALFASQTSSKYLDNDEDWNGIFENLNEDFIENSRRFYQGKCGLYSCVKNRLGMFQIPCRAYMNKEVSCMVCRVFMGYCSNTQRLKVFE